MANVIKLRLFPQKSPPHCLQKTAGWAFFALAAKQSVAPEL
jgi:hypothetical protein